MKTVSGIVVARNKNEQKSWKLNKILKSNVLTF